MALTHSQVDCADAIKTKLDANLLQLRLKHNYYGDTALVSEFPSTIIEPAGKVRAFNPGGLHKWRIGLSVSITALYARIEDAEIAVHDLDELVEGIENLLNQDLTLGGIVIEGWIESVTPGVRRLGPNLFYKASRLVWSGESQQIF